MSNSIEKSILCPKCGNTIDVNRVLHGQIEDELRKSFESKLAESKAEFAKKEGQLKSLQDKLEADRQALKSEIEKGVSDRLVRERKAVEAELRKRLSDEQAENIKAMQDELGKKSDELKEFNKAKGEIEKLKREKNELKSTIEAECEKKLSDEIAKEKVKLESGIELKVKEKEQLIERLKNDLAEAQRVAQEGSGRLKGEMQELAIEDWLKFAFPHDSVEEIKKGAKGGDCLQIVNTPTRQHCGTIYYESKRAIKFQPIWLEKFKEDMRAKQADIGVIVTEVFPADMQRMGLKEGIWICSYEEFKGLSAVLRESVIRVSDTLKHQENKGDKVNMLYNYLISNEFKMQIEVVLSGFSQMKSELEHERRAFEGVWKRREKLIEKILLNTAHMHSSFKGIVGDAIPAIPQLELYEAAQLTTAGILQSPLLAPPQ